MLIRNFRGRAQGKLAPRWTPEPFVVVTQLRENHPVYVLQPEGKEHPTRTAHRTNLRPCPLNMLQDNQEPTTESSPPATDQPSKLPPPTWWLPGLMMSTAQLTIPAALHQAESPEPPQKLAETQGHAPERCNQVKWTDDGRPVAGRVRSETWFNACNYEEYRNMNQVIPVERVWETTDRIDAV